MTEDGDDGPVRIPIDPVDEDDADDSRTWVGLVMLTLAGLAAAIIYIARGGDEQ